MKIFHVVNTSDFAGVGYYAWKMIKSFHSKGHQILVDTYLNGIVAQKTVKLGIIPSHFLNLRSKNPLKLAREYQILSHFLKREKPNLVVAHQSQGYWVVALACRNLKIPVIRVRGDENPPRNFPLNRVVLNRWTDGIVTTAQKTRGEAFRVLKGPPIKIKAILAPIEVPLGWEPKPFPNEKGRYFAVLGRLSPVKGHQNILTALQILKRKLEPLEAFRCDFITRPCGYSSEQLKNWIDNRGLSDSTAILGEIPNILELLPEYGFGLIGSLGSEVNCRAALEWGLSGRMVISTRVGVIPEIIRDGVDGILIPPHDPFAMAEALQWALKNPKSVREMGLNFRKRVLKEFNLEKFYQRVLAFFLGLIPAKEGS